MQVCHDRVRSGEKIVSGYAGRYAATAQSAQGDRLPVTISTATNNVKGADWSRGHGAREAQLVRSPYSQNICCEQHNPGPLRQTCTHRRRLRQLPTQQELDRSHA